MERTLYHINKPALISANSSSKSGVRICIIIQYVRLYIWHFMRRLAGGVTSESHPLYGTFMSQLSTAIFEWDMGDITHLTEAKKGELVSLGVSRPTDAAARKATTKEELLKHCRRRTRGVEETIVAIEQLLLSLSSATVTMGVPLLKQELTTIWAEQKKHIPCIQDPPRYHSLHCRWPPGQRRSETASPPMCQVVNWHLNLAGFIPGSSASAVITSRHSS